MERKPQSASARLIAKYQEQLSYSCFYRFCQLLEQSNLGVAVTGSDWQVRHEPVRFRPHPGMGFPASEIHSACESEHVHLPPSVHITFMGLYGVESPLPTHFINDVAQRREGHEAMQDFLDIFNHRMIAQFYRIWRKYSYPASFEAGGKDKTSLYLLGLAGLGIDGCAQNIASPVSRFLALLPVMLLPGRTAEGLSSLVSLLAPGTHARVWHHDRRRIPLRTPVAMRVNQAVSLESKPVMGDHAPDVNGQVLLQLSTTDAQEINGWLPGGQMYADLLALLHVWLGSRLDVRLQLCVERRYLPDATLTTQPVSDSPQLGRTSVLKPLREGNPEQSRILTINIGRYQHAGENLKRQETDEDGDYSWPGQ